MAQSTGVGGPFVSIATFCERVLQERDGVHTLVRVVDRYTLQVPPADRVAEGTKPGFQTQLFILVKSGDFKGDVTLSVRLRLPSGEYPPNTVFQTPLRMLGGEQGATFVANFVMGVGPTGLYWADVELDGRVVTRVPLRVELEEYQPGSMPASDGAEHPKR